MAIEAIGKFFTVLQTCPPAHDGSLPASDESRSLNPGSPQLRVDGKLGTTKLQALAHLSPMANSAQPERGLCSTTLAKRERCQQNN